jgi:glycosyltransferase involved in cell wall biosynthesis
VAKYPDHAVISLIFLAGDMKIALVTATFLPYRSGTAQMVWQIAQDMHHKGHEVVVFTPRGSSQPKFDFRVVYQKVLLRVGNAAFTPSLLQDLRGFDLIHLHYPYIFGAELVAFAARLYRIPLLLTYHQNLSASDYRRPLFWLYNHLVQPWVLSSAKTILVTSLDYALSPPSRLQKFRQRLLELPNAVDTNTFVPNPLKTSDRYVLFVGAMDKAHHFKGVDILLAALERLPDIKAIFVGDGDLLDTYQRLAEPCGSRVRFVGKVETKKLVQLYQQAWVTVLPSTTTGEAFGLVLLESMACGTPVIASSLPGVRYLVQRTQGGLLIPPNQIQAVCKGLVQLWYNPKQRYRLGKTARVQVQQQYSTKVVHARLESIYNQIMKRIK